MLAVGKHVGMGMKVSVGIAVIAACLAGCVDTSSPKFQQMSMQKCESFGYKPGSTEMANCRMQLTLLQEQDNMRRKQNMSRAMSELGDDMQRQADRNAYLQAVQDSKRINCTSTRYGNMVNTSCR